MFQAALIQPDTFCTAFYIHVHLSFYIKVLLLDRPQSDHIL